MSKLQNTLQPKAEANRGEPSRQSNKPQCKRQGLIVKCSAGHKYDLSLMATRFMHGDPKEGGRCPMVLSYDRLCGGSKTCRRVLRRSDISNTYSPSPSQHNEKENTNGN